MFKKVLTKINQWNFKKRLISRIILCLIFGIIFVLLIFLNIGIKGKNNSFLHYPEETYIKLEEEVKRIINTHDFDTRYTLVFNSDFNIDNQQFLIIIKGMDLEINTPIRKLRKTEDNLKNICQTMGLMYEIENKDFKFSIAEDEFVVKAYVKNFARDGQSFILERNYKSAHDLLRTRIIIIVIVSFACGMLLNTIIIFLSKKIQSRLYMY